MTGRDEAELRARFREVRAHDASVAPPFQPPAPAWSAALPRRRLWIGLAAAAILVAAVVRVAWFSLTEPPPPAPALDAWRVPTDLLLDHASLELFGAPPPIGSSVIDRFIPETSVFKGD